MDVAVLIVGAGPTGLMLANQLARRGVHAMIVDRRSGPVQQSRAMAVQPRTLEIYSKLGIAQRAVDLGKPGSGANMGAHQSLFPFVLMLGQDDNERILNARLGDFGLAVQWNTELLELEQRADHTVATLGQPDGTTRKVTAAWVAGCDGAHSAVRAFCGIEFAGGAYEHMFFVADVVATGDMVPDELNATCGSRDSTCSSPCVERTTGA